MGKHYTGSVKKDSHGTITTYRRYHLKKMYGITIDEYDDLFNRQNGCCALCQTPGGEKKLRLAVDHDHDTGQVRGLLCQRCNWAIGQLGDNLAGLLNAVEYMKGTTT